MNTNVDALIRVGVSFIKVMQRVVYTRAILFETRYTSEKIIILDMMGSNILLAVLKKKQIYFILRKLMES